MGVSLSWETDGRMNMRTAETMDIVFMNEAERKVYEHECAATEAWIKSSKHDVTVVATLGDVGAEAYFRGERFFCKARKVNVVNRIGGGDAFDAGFLDAWLDRRVLDQCLERGLQSASIVLRGIGPQYRSDT
jgi:sugar/nucleoside kinase (ribokinase family)